MFRNKKNLDLIDFHYQRDADFFDLADKVHDEFEGTYMKLPANETKQYVKL